MLQLSTVASTTADGCRSALKHQTLLAITPSQPLDRHLGSGTRTDGMPDSLRSARFQTHHHSCLQRAVVLTVSEAFIPCQLMIDKPCWFEDSERCNNLQNMSCGFRFGCSRSGVADLKLGLMIAVGLIC
jgi:hypothetical protein